MMVKLKVEFFDETIDRVIVRKISFGNFISTFELIKRQVLFSELADKEVKIYRKGNHIDHAHELIEQLIIFMLKLVLEVK